MPHAFLAATALVPSALTHRPKPNLENGRFDFSCWETICIIGRSSVFENVWVCDGFSGIFMSQRGARSRGFFAHKDEAIGVRVATYSKPVDRGGQEPDHLLEVDLPLRLVDELDSFFRDRIDDFHDGCLVGLKDICKYFDAILPDSHPEPIDLRENSHLYEIGGKNIQLIRNSHIGIPCQRFDFTQFGVSANR